MRRAFGAVIATAALATTGCSLQPNDYTLPGQVGVGGGGYTVTVEFNQVENLVPNSTVQLDDVTVGTVGSIAVKDWRAYVSIHLAKATKVPVSSVFSIGQKTLLGAQYVQISVPGESSAPTGMEPAAATTGPFLHDGDVVDVSHTGSYPATEEVLGAAALLLNNGGLSQISVITGQLSTALQDREPDTRALIDRTNQLLAVLDRDKGSIITALDGLDRLSGQLAGKKDVVARALDHIGPGLAELNKERENLVNAVTVAGRLSTQAADVVQVNQSALLANLESLQPILSRLAQVAGSLPDALKIAFTIPFPAMTTGDAIRGDYANLFANLDLSLPSLASQFLGSGTPSSSKLTHATPPPATGGAGGLATPAPPVTSPSHATTCVPRLTGGC